MVDGVKVEWNFLRVKTLGEEAVSSVHQLEKVALFLCSHKGKRMV